MYMYAYLRIDLAKKEAKGNFQELLFPFLPFQVKFLFKYQKQQVTRGSRKQKKVAT